MNAVCVRVCVCRVNNKLLLLRGIRKKHTNLGDAFWSNCQSVVLASSYHMHMVYVHIYLFVDQSPIGIYICSTLARCR